MTNHSRSYGEELQRGSCKAKAQSKAQLIDTNGIKNSFLKIGRRNMR